nr:MAG TPA: hypothetical protein [Caudoviricetes sp.]
MVNQVHVYLQIWALIELELSCKINDRLRPSPWSRILTKIVVVLINVVVFAIFDRIRNVIRARIAALINALKELLKFELANSLICLRRFLVNRFNHFIKALLFNISKMECHLTILIQINIEAIPNTLSAVIRIIGFPHSIVCNNMRNLILIQFAHYVPRHIPEIHCIRPRYFNLHKRVGVSPKFLAILITKYNGKVVIMTDNVTLNTL